MIQNEFCQDCHQQHDCRQVYRQLGHAACPSIINPVIRAFLMPLLIFIASLAILEKLFTAAGAEIQQLFQLSSPAKMQGLQTVVCFLMALLITTVCIFVTRVITKRRRKEF
jgi:uncharacterized protein involved in cysteine biosynthesis